LNRYRVDARRLSADRLLRFLVTTFAVTSALVFMAGCGGIAGGSNGNGLVGVANGSLNFGAVTVGDTKTLPNSISNNTTAPVTISAIQGLGDAFQVSGISLPIVLNAGQTVPFNVQFQPTDPGNPTTTIAFAGGNAQPYVAVNVSGNAVSLGKLAPNPSPVPFGHTKVGGHQAITVSLTNSGGTDLVINQATLSGAGFTMGTLGLPLTVHPGHSASLGVNFAPPAPGTFTGTVTFAITSDNKQSNVLLNISGMGDSSGMLAANPSSLSFGSVQVGSTSSRTETLTNTGGSTVNISQATISGAGFSVSGLSLPLSIESNQSASFTVNYAPTAAGASSGNLNIGSDANNSPLSIPLSGTGQAAGSLTASPTSASFGNVTVGTTQTVPIAVTNTGGSSVTLSSAAATGTGFSVTGPSLPLTLTAGQSATFNALFTPTSAGAASGTLAIGSNANNLSINLSGTGVAQGQLAASPSSFSFGNIQVGSSKSLAGTLTNSGGSSITISAAAATGSGFTLSGLSLPLTLPAGQSASFSVLFAPTTSGAATGSISVTSNGSNPNLSIPLSGTGVTAGTLTPNPASLVFGTVQTGGNSSLSETLTNSGGSSLTISAATATGAGFSLSGLSLPLTLSAGQSTSFTVTFSPSASGAASGSLTVTSNASNPNLTIVLSGTGTTPGTLVANPASLSFGSVQVGNSANLSETLTNSGGSSVTISQASVTGATFSITGLSLPLTLNAGQSVTFTAIFAPTASGAVSGSLSIVSNASNSPLSIALSGTGTASGTLAVSPTSLSFGNVVVGFSASLNGSLTASGASVTVNSASLNNGEFALSGVSLPLTLAAGQSTTFTVTFTPQASGATSASLSFSSNASNSPAVQTMTGTGKNPVQHSVDLTWSASPTAVGYNVYRGTISGGPYAMINSGLDGTTAYTDSTVVSGQTYYYVATAVDADSNESAYSNQTQVVVPNP
jgi:hypothetical protein